MWQSTTVIFSSVQSLSHIWLCVPMNRSTPGLPVHHQLPGSTQTHVHGVGDAIQPSHPLSSPSPPAPIPPSIRVFSSESALRIRWPKYWSFSFSICPSNEQPGLISFRMDWLDLLAVQGALKSTLWSGGDRRLVLAPLIPSPFLFFLWEKVLPPVRDLPWILSVALSGKAPLFLWSICSQCGGGQGQTYRLKG